MTNIYLCCCQIYFLHKRFNISFFLRRQKKCFLKMFSFPFVHRAKNASCLYYYLLHIQSVVVCVFCASGVKFSVLFFLGLTSAFLLIFFSIGTCVLNPNFLQNLFLRTMTPLINGKFQSSAGDSTSSSSRYADDSTLPNFLLIHITILIFKSKFRTACNVEK